MEHHRRNVMPSVRRSAGGGAVALALISAAGCATLPAHPELPAAFAIPPGHATTLDQSIAPLESTHEESSGFVLLSEGRTAFAARAGLTAAAQRSVDVQTYIWHADLTGKYLAYELLQAADRGVRVRLLLDDFDARAKNDPLLALDRHENIEVRLFNPLASRRGFFSYIGDFFRSFHRLNHRMHIKNWICDNRVAVAGGRNVGDEYFAASDETNFADVELLMVGPVVRDGSAEFDRFWNSPVVYPIAVLDPEESENADLNALRATLNAAAEEARASRYAEALRADTTVRNLGKGEAEMYWDSDAKLVADDPQKAEAKTVMEKSAVLSLLLPLIQGAQNEVLIASPYFVPGKEGTKLLVGLAQRGVRVRILTNSLAANDVAAVHGGYARFRKQLLEGGVQLWELKPQGEKPAKISLVGSSGASLHAKSLSIDGSGVFVGSYNLDARSTQLNAEMGVFVRNPDLGREFESSFAGAIEGDSAWQVSLEDGALRWSDGTRVLDKEPSAGWGRRFQAWSARVLHLDPLL